MKRPWVYMSSPSRSPLPPPSPPAPSRSSQSTRSERLSQATDKGLISSLFLKDTFNQFNILDWQVFFFYSILNISFLSLLDYRIPADKFTCSLLWIPMYVKVTYLLLILWFSLCLCQFNCNVSWFRPLWIQSIWWFLSFLNSISICKFRKLSDINFLI